MQTSPCDSSFLPVLIAFLKRLIQLYFTRHEIETGAGYQRFFIVGEINFHEQKWNYHEIDIFQRLLAIWFIEPDHIGICDIWFPTSLKNAARCKAGWAIDGGVENERWGMSFPNGMKPVRCFHPSPMPHWFQRTQFLSLWIMLLGSSNENIMSFEGRFQINLTMHENQLLKNQIFWCISWAPCQ